MSRASDTPASLAISEHIQHYGRPGAEEVSALATQLQLPDASVRGIATFYADLRDDESGITVCDGTSCRLAGSAELIENLGQRGSKVRKAYCLGHCDRSPALLDNSGGCHLQAQPLAISSGKKSGTAEPERHLPPLRCVASESIVTGRLLDGGAADLHTARTQGAYHVAQRILTRPPGEILEAMERSGICGRGGAGFPTGRKWRHCAESESDQRYVISNGDEGDPGSFVDRVLMEEDPHAILEGMLICGYTVGASEGIVYIRSEYPQAIRAMQRAINEADEAGHLGKRIHGSDFDFDVRIAAGLGSYVCGEETAMINAIEGLRGEVQIRPPYPTECGLFGKPTVVNNVETLANVPFIVDGGSADYASLGTADSKGTKVISLDHGFAKPGLVEIEFGITLREVIEDLGGGGRDGNELLAVLVGGPMGSLVLPDQWDLPVCYKTLNTNGIQFGHGGVIAIPACTNFRDLLMHLVEFMIDESCGKCAPCRLGSECLKRTLTSEQTKEATTARLEEIFTAMEQGSLCAFGEFMPGPMRQLIQHFGDQIITRK